MFSSSVFGIVLLTCPPNSSKDWVPERNNRKKKSWSTFPNSQHFMGRRACWSSGMGLGRTHKRKFKMKSIYTTKKKRRLVQANESGVANLI
jgi:hypothetical protein